MQVAEGDRIVGPAGGWAAWTAMRDDALVLLLESAGEDGVVLAGRTRLGTIAGVVPSLVGDIRGCSFRDRCSYARPECAAATPVHTVGDHSWRCIHRELPT